MDIETGKIIKLNKEEKKTVKKSLIAIEEKAMTKKQKDKMQVSLKDHKSKLGRKLTKEREKAGLSKNAERNRRRNLRQKFQKMKG